ncbi:MAG: beta-ketoacyl-[acyl-carrier-protein] synthase family protein [Phycisphaeraceae bacterium]|nr:beta-ketoacyl-[acyl-carrier-protein] synthase family protein [Phycisphaeraceae bacterium]
MVVTGVGLVTALGLSVSESWAAICEGRNGLGPMPALEQAPSPDKGGGQAPDLPDDFAPELPREARYLKFALEQAMAAAGLDKTVMRDSADRCGLVVGTTLHGIRAAGRYFRSGQFSDFDSFLAPATLHAAADGWPLDALALTTCSACSSGLGAVALGMTLLRSGTLDLVVCGGYDPVSEYAYAGFNSLRLVAEGPPKPFCRDREGLKLSEGYGVLVLERAPDAERRGAEASAVLLGYGESSDAHHLTQPHPEGDGAARAMEAAVRSAGLKPDQIDLISAHATATPNNDGGEYQALRRVFGDRLVELPVVAYKSHLGHSLGGAGAVELILTLEARRQKTVPPTAHVRREELEFDPIRLALDGPESQQIGPTLNNAFGFGGSNTSLISGSPGADPTVPHSRPDRREVYVTGAGVVVPGAIGNEAFVDLLWNRPPEPIADSGPIDPSAFEGLLHARRVRRMSDYVKMVLAAASVAARDAAIEDLPEFAHDAHAILGSAHGAAGYSWDYYKQVVAEGIAAANPMLFAEGVPNSGSAHLSLMMQLKGSAQTIIGSRTSGLEALRLASIRIETGQWERAIVAAGDEFCELTNRAFAECGLYRSTPGHQSAFDGRGGFAAGAGAVCLVLESADSCRRRSVEPKAQLLGHAGGVGRQGDVRHITNQVQKVVRDLGRPSHFLCSANATSIDRFEAAGLAAATEATVSSLYGPLAETFSVMPLASVAAVVLGRKLPPLRGNHGDLPDSLQAAAGTEKPGVLGVLAVDYAGLVAGTSLKMDGLALS